MLPVEEAEFGLEPLRQITRKIGEVCGLTLFSTEIALSSVGRFVAIDYVNDQPDFRPRSKAPDGIPDRVLNNIVADIVRWVKEYVQKAGRRHLPLASSQERRDPEGG